MNMIMYRKKSEPVPSTTDESTSLDSRVITKQVDHVSDSTLRDFLFLKHSKIY